MSAKARDTRLPVAKTYKIYIGGKFPRTESGRYIAFKNASGDIVGNVSRGSRKDFREAVRAARGAVAGWSGSSAYLRGQILYRIGEMLEGRSEQFVAELVSQGSKQKSARAEVAAAIDRVIYFAGWADKYQQIFSAVNPVSSKHFNFSVLEATGVVSIVAPDAPGLLGLVANVAPAICGGNACIALASESFPLSAISFAEVLESSDVPPGVVNVLTGLRAELLEHFASHMDVNAIVGCDLDSGQRETVQKLAAQNIKRVVTRNGFDWTGVQAANPYLVSDTTETKTTWHPIGS